MDAAAAEISAADQLTIISLLFAGTVVLCQKFTGRSLSHQAKGDILCVILILYGLDELASRHYTKSQVAKQGVSKKDGPQNSDDESVSMSPKRILSRAGAQYPCH